MNNLVPVITPSTALGAPIESLTAEEAVASHVVVGVLADSLGSRSSELRERIIADAKEHGELTKSGKSYVLDNGYGKATATFPADKVKINEGRLKVLLEGLSVPLTQVYHHQAVFQGAMDANALETLDECRRTLEEAGVTVKEKDVLNEKALEGLVALGIITAADLASCIDKNPQSPRLKVVGDKSFLSELESLLVEDENGQS